MFFFFFSDSSKPSPSQLKSRINDDDNSENFPSTKTKENSWRGGGLRKRVGIRNENLHTKTQKSRGSCTRNFAWAHLDAGGVAPADRRFGQKQKKKQKRKEKQTDIEKSENP